MRLLSIDFDFFFVDKFRLNDEQEWQLYDWGHLESRFFIESAWQSRSSGFLMNKLPLPGTTGEETEFWNRFTFSPQCRLFYSESHSSMANELVAKGVIEVVNYDAHHDGGYKDSDLENAWERGHYDCANWAALYRFRHVPVTVRYPRWIDIQDHGEPEPKVDVVLTQDDSESDHEPFDRVFVCRSGAWVPSWLDPEWEAFLEACPVSARRCVDRRGSVPRRAFTRDEAEEYARSWELVMALNTRSSSTGIPRGDVSVSP